MKTILVAIALAVLTLIFPRWIEAVTGLDPDAGSGAVEVLVVLGCALVAATRMLLLYARRPRAEH